MQFKFNQKFILKHEPNKTLIVSVNIEDNEVYEFNGPSGEILHKIYTTSSLTINDYHELLKSYHSKQEDGEALWNFLITKSIIQNG